METVEINGKTYTKDEVEQAKKIAMEAWENIKEVVSDVCEAIVSAMYTFIDELINKGYTEEQAVEYLSSTIKRE